MAAHLELMRELSIEDGPYGVIEQTTADEAAPAVAADSGVRRGSPRLAAMAARLRSALFRQAAPAPVGWRKILGGAAFLMMGAAASLARTAGPAMAWAPVAVFAILLGVAAGFNYRVHNTRSDSPPWTAVVAAARQSCQKPTLGKYIYRHAWWTVKNSM
jgi:hypothetical protein